MEKVVTYQYMAFNVKILKFLNLWLEDGEDDKNKWRNKKTYYVFILLFPTMCPLFLEAFLVQIESRADIVTKIQVVLAEICCSGATYMGICFLQNRSEIKHLLNSIGNFAKRSNLDIVSIDRKASLFSKVVIAYSIIGILIYGTAPLSSQKTCNEKSEYHAHYGIPCGTIVPFRLPFRYNESPLYEFYVVHELVTAGTAVLVIITITMLVCGILEHIINQMKEVRKYVLNISETPDGEIVAAVRFSVKYHCEVIEFVQKLNKSFGSQLVLHFTITSIVISVLGFVIVMVDDTKERLQYALHLIGWLVMLYNICHRGQLLIDESLGVATDAYFTPWYNSPTNIQKDIKLIILRAQKPLTLKALNLGILSEKTFLGVITSSYSYFTLLLNLKSS